MGKQSSGFYASEKDIQLGDLIGRICQLENQVSLIGEPQPMTFGVASTLEEPIKDPQVEENRKAIELCYLSMEALSKSFKSYEDEQNKKHEEMRELLNEMAIQIHERFEEEMSKKSVQAVMIKEEIKKPWWKFWAKG